MGKVLSYLKNWGIRIKCCWNYGSSKLLLHFIEYRVDQLNNKHMKIAVNSTTRYFESHSQKKMSAKSFRFFGPPTTKWRSCKIVVKLNRNHLLMVNIFKLHELKTFGLMKMHNMSKIWFANYIFLFSLWKSLVYN